MHPVRRMLPFYSCFILLSSLFLKTETSSAAENDPGVFPVVGLAIAAPEPGDLDQFLDFMVNDMVADGVNTLLLRVDFRYEYESYPNLRDENPLSKEQVKRIVRAAKDSGIRLIPHINLLGHQSWHETLGNLLTAYPEFDETPHIQLPTAYEWPNPDGLYCKSYCPLHPDVHKVVFALVDELMDAFEATAFHPGLDEVFYIGDDKCPRCAGKDKAELFAGEVIRIHEHLKARGMQMWMWGDRLIDGKTTGIGMWEASENDTFRAIDSIPKDIVICDWHYEKAEPTAAYFVSKGFPVVTCPWNKGLVAREQVKMMADLLEASSPEEKALVLGMMQTVWSPCAPFVEAYQSGKGEEGTKKQVNCYRDMTDSIWELNH